MQETLCEYLRETDTPELKAESDLMTKLGGPKSQYYEACYKMAKVMIIGND